MIKAALSEARYAAAMWSRDAATARRELEKTIDKTATYDAKVEMWWHSVWLGAAFELDGDSDSAYREYGIATRRLSSSIVLPRSKVLGTNQDDSVELCSFGRSLSELLSYPQGAKFRKRIRWTSEYYGKNRDRHT